MASYHNNPEKSKPYKKAAGPSSQFRVPLELLGDDTMFNKKQRIYLLHLLYPGYTNTMTAEGIASLFHDISKSEVENHRSKLVKEGKLRSIKVPMPGRNPFTHHQAVISNEGTQLNLAQLNKGGETWTFYAVRHADDGITENITESYEEDDAPPAPEPAKPSKKEAPQAAPATPPVTSAPEAVSFSRKDLEQRVLGTIQAAARKFAKERKLSDFGVGGLQTASTGFVTALLRALSQRDPAPEADIITELCNPATDLYAPLIEKGVAHIVGSLRSDAQHGSFIQALQAGMDADHPVIEAAYYEPPPPPPEDAYETPAFVKMFREDVARPAKRIFWLVLTEEERALILQRGADAFASQPKSFVSSPLGWEEGKAFRGYLKKELRELNDGRYAENERLIRDL